jgi:hypothetical protein
LILLDDLPLAFSRGEISWYFHISISIEYFVLQSSRVQVLLPTGVSAVGLISSDGEITKLSRMNPEYVPPEVRKQDYFAYYYSWSPDGEHVALWLKDADSEEITLAILDIQTGVITDTCIPAGYNPRDIRTLPTPAWSPDSSSLVVAANSEPETGDFEAMLVDLSGAAAYRIAQNRFPAGWLAAP